MKRPITETSTTEKDLMTTTTTSPDENTGRTESQETTAKSTTVSSINTETPVPTPKETPKPEISTKTTEEPTTELGNCIDFFYFFFITVVYGVFRDDEPMACVPEVARTTIYLAIYPRKQIAFDNHSVQKN